MTRTSIVHEVLTALPKWKKHKCISSEQHIENNCSYYSEAIMKHTKEVNKYFHNHHPVGYAE